MIDRLPKGYVFTYMNLGIEVKKRSRYQIPEPDGSEWQNYQVIQRQILQT